jgi:hypothetical protein
MIGPIPSDATKINVEKSSNSEKEKRLMNFKLSFIYIFIILFENNFAIFFQRAKKNKTNKRNKFIKLINIIIQLINIF